jgi:hypothetical protein
LRNGNVNNIIINNNINKSRDARLGDNFAC